MKRYSLIAIILLLGLLVVPARQARAEDEADVAMRQYFSLSAGSYLPTQRSSSTGNCVALGYGLAPLPYLALETNVGYQQSEEVDFLFMAVSLTETVKPTYSFGLGNIYGLMGGGMYYTAYHFNGDHAATNFPTSDDKLAFGYFLGGGGEWYLQSNITVGVEFKWLELKATFDKLKNTTLDNLANHDYSGAMIMGRVTYNF